MGNNVCYDSLQAKEKDVVKVAGKDLLHNEESINSWNFSPLDLTNEDLQRVSSWILLQVRGQYSHMYQAERSTVEGFVARALAGYIANPYHNSYHAVDVVHTLFRYGSMISWHRLFPSIIRFSMLVAALCHDIGHPGFSNAFLIDVQDEIARCYNDSSPLENMHCSKLLRILEDPDCNVFGHLSREDFREVQELMSSAILHTDMAHHASMLAALVSLHAENSALFDAGGNEASELTQEQVELMTSSPERRSLVVNNLLHGSDILNPARPWPIAYKWAHYLSAEFHRQGDKERELGLPVSSLNDRTKSSIPELQVGFVQFVYAPYLAAQARLFPMLEELLQSLARNAVQWGEQLKSIDAAGADTVDARIQEITDALWGKAKASAVCDDDLRDNTETAAEEAASETVTRGPRSDKRLIREVRRWRECDTGTDGMARDAAGRELVLLYVLPGEGDDTPKPYAPLEECAAVPRDRAEDVFRRQASVGGQVAVDTISAQLDRGTFDMLLTSLLELRATVPPDGE